MAKPEVSQFQPIGDAMRRFVHQERKKLDPSDSGQNPADDEQTIRGLKDLGRLRRNDAVLDKQDKPETEEPAEPAEKKLSKAEQRAQRRREKAKAGQDSAEVKQAPSDTLPKDLGPEHITITGTDEKGKPIFGAIKIRPKKRPDAPTETSAAPTETTSANSKARPYIFSPEHHPSSDPIASADAFDMGDNARFKYQQDQAGLKKRKQPEKKLKSRETKNGSSSNSEFDQAHKILFDTKTSNAEKSQAAKVLGNLYAERIRGMNPNDPRREQELNTLNTFRRLEKAYSEATEPMGPPSSARFDALPQVPEQPPAPEPASPTVPLKERLSDELWQAAFEDTEDPTKLNEQLSAINVLWQQLNKQLEPITVPEEALPVQKKIAELEKRRGVIQGKLEQATQGSEKEEQSEEEQLREELGAAWEEEIKPTYVELGYSPEEIEAMIRIQKPKAIERMFAEFKKQE